MGSLTDHHQLLSHIPLNTPEQVAEARAYLERTAPDLIDMVLGGD